MIWTGQASEDWSDKGKPLFEMCCFHMDISRKGGGVKACQYGLGNAPFVPTHFKKWLPLLGLVEVDGLV